MWAGGGQRVRVVHGLSTRPAGLAPVRRTRPQIHRILPLSWGCEPLDSARCTMRSCRLGLTALDVAKQLVAGRIGERMELVSARKPPLRHEIYDAPPHFRRGFSHGTGRIDITEGRSASNRSTFPIFGHRRPCPWWCAGAGGRNPQVMMAALRQRGVFDVVRPHACAVAQSNRCGAGWRPVSTMRRCAQTHRRRGSAPGRDRDAQGC